MKIERASRSGRGGFTLLEVLVALALFAISTLVLAGAYVNVLNAIDSVKVDRVLEEELAFVRAQVLLEPDLEEVERGGNVPTATHGEATWTATVTPSERVADLFRVELEIELVGDGDRVPERTVKETLYLLRPSWSQPVDREKIREQRRRELDEARRTRPL